MLPQLPCQACASAARELRAWRRRQTAKCLHGCRPWRCLRWWLRALALTASLSGTAAATAAATGGAGDVCLPRQQLWPPPTTMLNLSIPLQWVKSHAQHDGEQFVQRMRGSAPDQHVRLQHHLQDSHVMPAQHSLFFSQLPYMGLGALDAQGRPWATLLATRVVATSQSTLAVNAALVDGDPLVAALASLEEPRLFAGVGVDYSNRRRNKLSGFITAASASAEARSLDLQLTTTENMGNCPKYITVRKLVPFSREPAPPVALGASLDADSRALLSRCSTAYLASRHIDASGPDSDMGFNHRGGPPGFLRYYEDADGAHIVLPDYSGNQLYQSLGNVQTDPLVGLVALDFASGDSLHVTGRAHNLYNDEAEALMPRCTLVTVITIDDAVLLKNALQLRLEGPEAFSPYNPPVRLLASELAAAGRPLALTASGDATATLVAVQRHTLLVSSFTFRLSQPADVPPAGFAVFDFSNVIDKPYMHMNPSNPRLVNDDLVRTWTVTRSEEGGALLSVTVKRQEGGLISGILHSLPPPDEQRVTVLFRGHGGGALNCFDAAGAAPPRMTWLAAGVGITPFLALHRELQRRGTRFAATLLYSCRGDERLLSDEIAADPRVTVLLFDSTAPADGDAPPALRRRRLGAGDVLAVEGVAESAAFLCGPPAYMAAAHGWLQAAGLPAELIREESFAF